MTLMGVIPIEVKRNLWGQETDGFGSEAKIVNWLLVLDALLA